MNIKQIEIQFLEIYPKGFKDDMYILDHKKYDDTKVRDIFKNELSKKNMKHAIKNNEFSSLVKPVHSVITKAWMTSKFEKIGFKHFIKFEETHDIFFVLLYEVMYGDIENSFDQFVSILRTHIDSDECANAAKWPILSCFLYYSRKDFFPVKPMTTKKMAKSLNFDIKYRPIPNLETYRAINDMYLNALNESTLCKTKEEIDSVLYTVLA